MKFKLVSKIFVSSLLTLGAITFGVADLNNKTNEAVAAVDINDYSACETAHNNGSASNLLTALRNITAPGSAGSYAQLWSTYNTCYVRDDGYLFDYYSSISNYVPGGSAQGAGYKKEGDSYNREHSIPKSWWGGAETNQGADPYIVVPTDGYVNNARSNYPFGIVSNVSKTYSNSKLGTSSSYGYTSTVFEPDDSVKGDFARIYFYAIAKYSNSYNWTSGEGSSCFSGSASTNFGLTNYAVKLFSYWSNLDPVDDWERSVNDNVAKIQKNRNPFIDHPEYANTLWGNVSGYTTYSHGASNVGITSISKTTANLTKGGNTTTISAVSSNSGTISWTTSNSNICSISSNSSASGSSITLTSGNTTGTATITASITISGTTYSKTCTVTVSEPKSLSSISISGQTTQLTVNSAFSFGGTVTANYSDSTSADVTSSATFSGYNMSTTGNYTVTVSYTEGGTTKTKTYTLTVSEASGDYEKVTSTSDITDGSYLIVYETGNVALNSALTSDQASNTINVTISNNKIQSNSTTDAASFTIKASNGTILGTGGSYIYHSGSNNTLNYTTTENSATNILSISNGNFVAKCGTYYLRYNNSSGQYRFRYYSSSGSQQAIQLYKKPSSSGSTKTLSSISVDGYNDSFTVGDTFSFGGTVTAHYSDTTTADVTVSATFSGYNMSNTGQQTVTVSYIEGGTTKTTTYNITVSAAKTLSSIAVQTAPTKISYTVDDTFDPTGLVITRNYSDSTTDTYTYANHTSEFTFSPSLSTSLSTLDTSVSITYGGKSCSQAITVTTSGGSGGGGSSDPSNISGTYSLYSGELTEGNYVIVYDGKALKNTISSNRLNYDTPTISNNSIANPSASIVWYISQSGGYWTLFNNNVSKYAAGNRTKNQAALVSDISDSSKWTASEASTNPSKYEFVNKGNDSSSVNATLRENETYGFACYSTQTGGALTLYKQESQIIENGRYYILNSDETKGLSAQAYPSSSPSAITVSSTQCNAFDFTLKDDGAYEITTMINSVKYYLVHNNTLTSGSNTYIRVTSSPSESLKSKKWNITENGNGFYLKENTTGSVYRTLTYVSGNSNWQGYSSSGTDQEIHLVAEGSKVASTVTSINNLTCNNGVTPPSTSSWSSIATAYGNISILSEKNYFKNTTANQLGTSIQQAAAKYDYIVGKYGTSSYSDFANRNPASLNSGAVLQIAQINDNMLITVVCTMAIVSFVGFTYCLYIKKKRNRE